MPRIRTELRSPRNWAVIGSIVTYFVLIKEIPATMRMLKVGYLFPLGFKKFLLNLINNSELWYILLFTGFLSIIFLFLMFRNKPIQENPNYDFTQQGIKYLKSSRIIRAIRSLGLIPLKEFLMDHMEIAIYGTFKRPSEWSRNLKTWSYMDRITFNSGRGSEYQYAKNFNYITVREHPETSDNYDQPTERKPTWGDFKYLIVASWFFPFWGVIHLLKRPFAG